MLSIEGRTSFLVSFPEKLLQEGEERERELGEKEWKGAREQSISRYGEDLGIDFAKRSTRIRSRINRKSRLGCYSFLPEINRHVGVKMCRAIVFLLRNAAAFYLARAECCDQGSWFKRESHQRDEGIKEV